MAATKHSRTSATALVNRDGEEPEPGDPLLQFAPVPHKQLRRNSIGPERQRRFIAHLAATGIVTQAARHIGASMEALYKLRRWPGAEQFSAAWDAAVDRGIARLEDCAIARAIEGEERLVVSAGKVLGTERRHNEALVMFLLRNRRAERYNGGGATRLGPRHPEYQRIRSEVLAEQRAGQLSEEDVLATLKERFERLRRHQVNPEHDPAEGRAMLEDQRDD